MSFKQWCLKHFSVKTSSNATHLFMDKGKIKVPLESYPEFLKLYFDSLLNENICLIEKLGSHCLMRFFLDVDFKNSSTVDIYDVLYNVVNVGNDICKCVGDVFICNQKKGLHIVYNKVVNCADACELCENIVNNLDAQYKKYIDSSVYKTGLRMVGSCKYTNNTLDERYYVPMYNDFTFEMLKKSIVRIKTQKSENIDNCNEINTESSIFEKFINKEFNVSLKILSYKKYNNYISCTTDSKYCTNVNRTHKNSKVYYVFDLHKKICYQKCFCPCLQPIVFNSCRNYKSKHVNVPYVLISALLETC